MHYEFVLTGTMPLLMHADNVILADQINAWRKAEENQKLPGKKKGDDRSPAWTWMSYLYQDGEKLFMPSDNVQQCLIGAGARIPFKNNKTFKEFAASLLLFDAAELAFTVDGKPVLMAPYLKLEGELDFTTHLASVRKVGQFDLFTKRARVGQDKHVRVRPRFESWQVSGVIEVVEDDVIDFDRLDTLFRIGGKLGLCDWRPSSKRSPGPFGMFEHTLKKAK